MKKKIKDGSLYFRQRDILRPLGAVLLPIGLVVIYFGWSFISYIFGSIAVPAGLILFIVGGAKIITDNDMAEQIDHAMLDYDKPITDMDGFERSVLKQPAPVEVTAYCFGEPARYFKKGKNGTLVSDRLTRSHFFFTKNSLLVAARTLSVAELNEATGQGISDVCEHLLLSSIHSAELCMHETDVTLTNTGRVTKVKWCELVVKGMGGDGQEVELLRLPVKNDMDATGLCDDINHRCGG